jgi:pimeloyl-ACP methyl ester carboxylesterase
MRLGLSSILLALQAVAVAAQGTILDGPFPEDLHGSNFTYPWPVKVYRFTSQFQQLDMAFMDVPPAAASTPNGKTAVLLHGKNFCGPTWQNTIRALTGAGYRVVAPDQVGFCKSSKPAGYQFSLHQLAMNTHGLTQALGIERFTIIGHSVGAMLTTRFALQYPGVLDEVVLVSPSGSRTTCKRACRT